MYLPPSGRERVPVTTRNHLIDYAVQQALYGPGRKHSTLIRLISRSQSRFAPFQTTRLVQSRLPRVLRLLW